MAKQKHKYLAEKLPENRPISSGLYKHNPALKVLPILSGWSFTDISQTQPILVFLGLTWLLIFLFLLYFFYKKKNHKKEDYQFFFEHSNEGLIVVSKEKIAHISTKATELLNRNKGEIIGKTIKTLAKENEKYFGDFLQKWTKSKAEIVRNGNALFEWTIHQENKPQRWIGTSLKLIKQENTTSILVSLRDISEFKRVQVQVSGELREKNALINSTDNLIWSLDHEKKLRSCNAAFLARVEQETGRILKPGDLLFSSEYEGEIATTWRSYYQRVFAGEVVKTINPQTFKGVTSYSDISLHPIYENDRIIGVSCSSKDVTKKTEALLATQASEKKYRKFQERITTAYAAFDNDWQCTYINKKAANTWNKEPEELLGKNLWEELSKIVGGNFHQVLLQAKETGVFTQQEKYYAPWDKWFTFFIYPDEEGVSVFFHDVTEQRKAEQKLLEQESLLGKIYDSTSDSMGIYKVTEEGTFEYVSMNQRSKNQLHHQGILPEECIGVNLIPLLQDKLGRSPEEVSLVAKHFQAVVETKDSVRHSSSGKSIHGSTFYAESIYNPINDESGKCSHILWAVRDMTAQKVANMQLANELREKDALINNTDDLIWSIDPEMRLISFNYSFARQVGKFLQRPLKKGDMAISKASGEEMYSKWTQHYERALKGEKYISLDSQEVEDRLIYIETSFYPIKEKEEIVGVSCLSKNITEKTTALHKVQASEKKYRQYQERITTAFITLDNEWNILFLNQKGSEIIGKSHEDLLGKNIWEEIPETANTSFYHIYHKAQQDGVFTKHEALFEPWNKWFSTYIYPDAEGISIFFHDITAQKETEQQLKEHESLIARLYDSTSEGMSVFKVTDKGQFVLLSVNQALVELFQSLGVQAEDYYGIELSRGLKETGIMDKEDAIKVKKQFEKAVKTKRTINYQLPLEKKGITHLHVELTYNPVIDESGKCTHLICVVRDVTQQIAMRLQLANELIEKDALINNTDDLIWSIDSEMRLISYNAPLINRLEKYLKRPLHKGDFMVIPKLGKEASEKWRQYYERALKGEQFLVLEKGLEKGKMVYAETSFYPIEEKGKIVGVSCFSKDVSEKTQAILDLTVSEEKYRSQMERISNAFVAFDNDWNYTYVNSKAGEMLGNAPELLIGKNVWELFPEGVDQPFYKALHKAKESQEFLHAEMYYPPWDKWYEDFIYPSHDGVSVFYHDITEQKRIEQQLQEQQSLFEKIYEATSDGMGLYEIADDGRFILLSVNQIMEKVFQKGGNSSKDFYGMEMKKVMQEGFRFSREEALEREKDYREVAKTLKPIHRSRTLINKDKSIGEFLLTYNPILDETGKCTHLLIVVRNITLEKNSERKVAESQRQLNLIYNSTNEVMILFRCENEDNYFIESANYPFFKLAQFANPHSKPEDFIELFIDRDLPNRFPMSVSPNVFLKIFETLNLSKKRKEITRLDLNLVLQQKTGQKVKLF